MNFLTFDVETSGTLREYALQPWRVAQGKSWLTSWAAVSEGGSRIDGETMPRGTTVLAEMLQRAIDNDLRIAGWYVHFDISWLIALGLEDLVFKVKWLDGMLLWKHYFLEPEYEVILKKKKSYGLKSYVAEYLPDMAGYQDDIDFHATDPAQLARLHQYNIYDCIATYVAVENLWSKLTGRQRRCALVEAAMLPHVARANLFGMPIDTIYCRDLGARLIKTAADQFQKLREHGVTEEVVRSPAQLSTLIFDRWGLTPFKMNKSKITGKETRSTDKEVLHELSHLDPRCKELVKYREALNNNTKFAQAPLLSAEYNGDWRTHPLANVSGTYTGRLTYSSKQTWKEPLILKNGKMVNREHERAIGFALHQEKRGAEYRDILIPPPGYLLLEFDAAGQEFKWMAIASEDPVMLQLCMPGEDPHSYMATQIDHSTSYRELMVDAKKDPKAKKIRFGGKFANLSLQYRTSWRKLMSKARVEHNWPMEIEEAKRIHGTYPRTYTQVPVYWESSIQLVKSLGYAETFAGRRVQVVGDWNGKFGWSMGSTAINFRIQGTGADQKYLAISVISSYLRSIRAYFAWDLHDGIYIYVPEHMAESAARSIKYLLDNLPYKRAWGQDFSVPLNWDCKLGPSWGQLKEMDF